MCCRLIRDNLSPTPYAARNLLAEGRNTVRLVAKDLTGKTTVLEHQVFADWQGPTIALEEPASASALRSPMKAASGR